MEKTTKSTSSRNLFSLLTRLKESLITTVLLLTPFISFAAWYPTYDVGLMDEIVIEIDKNWLDTDPTDPIDWNRCRWEITPSRGICWPDGSTGTKTTGATVTVVGIMPYDVNQLDENLTFFYRYTSGPYYYDYKYRVCVLPPASGKVAYDYNNESTYFYKLFVNEKRLINVEYPEISGDRYYHTEYSSSAPEIIEINDKGEYTAKKPGDATITVKQYVANKKYPNLGSYCFFTTDRTFSVYEKTEYESFEVLDDIIYVKRPETKESLKIITHIKYTPFDANTVFSIRALGTDYEITSNRLDSASGDEPGTKKIRFWIPYEEESTLVFTTSNGLEDRCKVIVYDPAESVILDKTQLQVNVGEDIKLNATVMPENATYKDLTWTSEDESVATVDNTGLIHALKGGRTRINAKSGIDNIEASCDVTVIQPVKAIYLSKSAITIKPGEFETLTAYVSPEDANNKSLNWKSLDDKVAKVENGTIMGISCGSTLVQAVAEDGSGTSAQCAVTVNDGSGIDDVLTDKNAHVKIFNLQGHLIHDGIYTEAHLSPDYYILMYNGKYIKIRIE